MSPAPIAAQSPDGTTPSFPRSEPAGTLPQIALGALVLIQAALILTHSPWRDELQALMLAWHSPSLGALFGNLHYEGHPSLWFLLLRLVSPLGHPTATLKVVQLIIAFSTITLVWTRVPFDPWTRILILASYLILFEWGAIARSYGLGMALYFGFLAMNRRPLAAYLMLGLVANVAAHFLMLAGGSALFLLLIDRNRSVAGPLLFAASIVIAVATAWPAPDAHHTATLAPDVLTRFGAAFETISGALVPIDPREIPPQWGGLTLPASVLAGVLILPLGAAALARSRIGAGAFLLLCAGVLAFSFFVYPAFTRHTGVIFLFLIGAEWMLAERGLGSISLLSRSWIALMAACGLWMGAWALFIPFTAMHDVARAIDARGLKDAQWAAYPSFIGVELSARLGHPYYDVQQQCLAWFQKWNTASVKGVKAAELDQRLLDAAASSGGRILLLTEADYGTDAPDLVPVETFKHGLFPEPMRIYEVKASADGASPPLAACD